MSPIKKPFTQVATVNAILFVIALIYTAFNSPATSSGFVSNAAFVLFSFFCFNFIGAVILLFVSIFVVSVRNYFLSMLLLSGMLLLSSLTLCSIVGFG